MSDDLRDRRWATVQEDIHALEFLKPDGQELTHPTASDVREHLAYLTTAFPDIELVVERVHQADDAVIVEGRSVGTHRGEFMGAAGTGRRMNVRACVVYRFDGDRLTNETVYSDLATQLRQLGLR